MKQFIELPENIEDLYPLVVLECKLIKEHFSEEEINKLELSIIDPTSEVACIYGTMVGSCNNPKVISFINNNLNVLIIGKFKTIEENIRDEDRCGYYMTPMEEYIYEKYKDWDNWDDIILRKKTKERIQKVINLLKN